MNCLNKIIANLILLERLKNLCMNHVSINNFMNFPVCLTVHQLSITNSNLKDISSVLDVFPNLEKIDFDGSIAFDRKTITFEKKQKELQEAINHKILEKKQISSANFEGFKQIPIPVWREIQKLSENPSFSSVNKQLNWSHKKQEIEFLNNGVVTPKTLRREHQLKLDSLNDLMQYFGEKGSKRIKTLNFKGNKEFKFKFDEEELKIISEYFSAVTKN